VAQLNISFMVMTLPVSQTACGWSKALALRNMNAMIVTLPVSQAS
jgi:hypothetical protein